MFLQALLNLVLYQINNPTCFLLFSLHFSVLSFTLDNLLHIFSLFLSFPFIHINIISFALINRFMQSQQKTYIEELREKESSYGKIFKVSGPCNFFHLHSGCCRKDGWIQNVLARQSWV